MMGSKYFQQPSVANPDKSNPLFQCRMRDLEKEIEDLRQTVEKSRKVHRESSNTHMEFLRSNPGVEETDPTSEQEQKEHHERIKKFETTHILIQEHIRELERARISLAAGGLDPNDAFFKKMGTLTSLPDDVEPYLDAVYKIQLVQAFATELSNRFGQLKSSKYSRVLFAEALEHFSWLSEYTNPTGSTRRAIHFLRRERDGIALGLYNGSQSNRPGPYSPILEPEVERTSRSVPITLSESTHSRGGDEAVAQSSNDVDSNIRDMVDAFSTLTASAEFGWLLSWCNIAGSTLPTGDIINWRRQDIIHAVQGSSNANYSLDWDPLGFLMDEYDSPGLTSICQAICLVGSGSNVQAMTCAQYVSTMWPKFGFEVLKVLDSVFRAMWKNESKRRTGVAQERSQFFLRIQMTQDGTSVKVSGLNFATVVEIGEILCWLSAVCRVSSEPHGVTYISPQVSKDDKTGVIRITHKETRPGSPEYPQYDCQSSSCWKQIFKNPVVCVGYPIDLRPDDVLGLQIPLDIMATLGCAMTAAMYGANLVLKGLCSAFLPVLKVGESLVWHYVANEDSSWMSHNVVLEHADTLSDLQFGEMEFTKHFVGWSRSVRENIGRPDLPYDAIHEAKVDDVGPGFAWDGITIGLSKVVEVSTKFSVGKRDSRLYFQRGGTYPRTIDISAGMTVVFYDEPARRAWLTNGSSALLFLTRTALSSTYSHGAGDKSRRILDQFDEEVALLPANPSSDEILLSDKIRSILLYGDDAHPQDSWSLESFVLEQWNLLDEIRSRQVLLSASANNQRPVKLPASPRIEGFQFVDMISCTGPLRPKYKDLQVGTKWSELPGKINSVTIFGASFGQLLQPLEQQCKASLTVPSGCDVLVAPNRLLNPRLPGRGGENHGDCVELVDGLFWTEPQESFPTDPCPCTHQTQPGSCGKVVTVFETTRPKKLKGKTVVGAGGQNIFERFPNGAIIIGSEASVRKANGQQPVSEEQLSPQSSRDSGYHSGSSPSPSGASTVSPSASNHPSVRMLIYATRGRLRRALGIKTTKGN